MTEHISPKEYRDPIVHGSAPSGRDPETRQAIEPSKLAYLIEQMEEVRDLLSALDLMGDGIGGDQGFAVSAVALQARSVAENVWHSLKVMEESRACAPDATPSQASACEEA